MTENLASWRLLKLFPWALLGINLALKSLFLTSQPVSLDEPFSIYHAQFPLDVLIDQLKNYNNPPLYEIILHFWIRVFGIDPAAVRWLPALFACLCPPALYLLARRQFGLYVAVFASALLTLSNLLSFYAHDCRVYSLFLLLTILSMHLYLTFSGRTSLVRALGYVLVSALLIYSHYFGFFVLFIQLIHTLLFNLKIRKYVIFCMAAIALLYVPQALVMLGRTTTTVKEGTWVEPPSGVESLYNMLWSFCNAPVVTVACLVLGFFAVVKVVRRWRTFRTHDALWLCLIWFLTAYMGMFVLSYVVPMYIDRYLIYALPAFYILLARCCQLLFEGIGARVLVMMGLAIGFAISIEPDPDKNQPVDEVMAVIKQKKDGATLVLVQPFDFLPTFAYHYDRNAFRCAGDLREYRCMDSLLRAQNIFHVYFGESGAFKADPSQRIIYLRIGDPPGKDELQQKLSLQRRTEWEKRFESEWKITCFAER